MRSFTSFLLIYSWPKQHLLLGLAYQNELSLLKLLTMNTKFYFANKDAKFLFFGGKEAMLRTVTTKFYYNNAMSESVEYEVMNEQRRSATVVHRTLFLQLLALSFDDDEESSNQQYPIV